MTSTLSNTSFVPTPPHEAHASTPHKTAMEKTSSTRSNNGAGKSPLRKDSNGNDPASSLPPSTPVTKLRENDVLLGRGGGTNNHAGNVKFRKLINEHKLRYLAASKVDKPKVAREVVQLWRQMNPPGRFLSRSDEDNSEKSNSNSNNNVATDEGTVWHDVGDKKANAKASQCLRERTPEVMPYLRQLREQQDINTEQGVMMVRQQQQQQQQTATPSAYPVDPFAPQHPHTSPGAEAAVSSPYSPMSSASNPAMMGGYSGMMHASPASARGTVSMQSPTAAFPSPQQQQAAMGANGMYHVSPHQQRQMSPHRGGAFPIGPPPVHQPSAPPVVPPTPPLVAPVDPSVATYYGDMTDYEYEQSMMIMQQQLEMQQMQLRRMQQQRAMQRAALSGQSPAQQTEPPSAYSGISPTAKASASPSAAREAPDSNARKPKRTLSMTKPERTNSGLSALRMDVNHELPTTAEVDGELTLEEYRQQLEAYISNTQNDDQEGEASDLEDDWEKERDRHMHSGRRGVARNRSSRGVDRAKSGASFMSIGTSTGMSMVSGFSNLSDLMSAVDEPDQDPAGADQTRKVDRTVSNQSNLSIMSELTDLSANIDNLSLYED